MTRIGTLASAFACLLVALCLGLWLGGHPDKLPGPIRDAFVSDDRALRAEVLDTISQNFYKPVNQAKLENASLKGIVNALDDPFSHYLTPKEAKQLAESISGEFEGVGMSVDQDKRGLLVLNVFDRSPAKRAGIQKDDVITAVNGRSIAGVSSQVATSRIKGRSGTRVKLEVLSRDPERRRTVTLQRARIDVPLSERKIVERDGQKVGVVRLLAFSDGAHGFVRRDIEWARKQGAKGLVLDLRGNGGGLLREAVLVSSVFIEDGKIVSVRGRHRSERTENAEGDAIPKDFPVVVLVDRGSASASEIVTGALRDTKRATVVGTRTFGKGLVQEVETLSNGGVLDLTVANYYLPGGKTITRKGLQPQVKAKDNPDTRRDEALPVAIDALLDRSR